MEQADPAAAVPDDFDRLLAEIRGCTLCAASLPLGPRPVLRGRSTARLLIVSQAPGIRVHETGLSFNDRSGDRLRDWLALDRAAFYDEARIGILPVGNKANNRGSAVASTSRLSTVSWLD